MKQTFLKRHENVFLPAPTLVVTLFNDIIYDNHNNMWT